MIRHFSPLQRVLQLVLDMVLTLASVKLAEQLRMHVATGLERRDGNFAAIHPGVFLLVAIIWLFFLLLFGALDRRRGSSLIADLLQSWLAISVSMLVAASLFYLLALEPPAAPSRLFYLYFYAIDLTLVGAARVLTFGVVAVSRRRENQVRRVLLVGAGIHGRQIAVRLQGQQGTGLRLVGYIAPEGAAPLHKVPRLGGLDDCLNLIERERIDDVVIALPASAHSEVAHLSERLNGADVEIYVLPDMFEIIAMRARIEDFYGLPLISVREPSMTPLQVRVKRVFDVMVAGIVAILLSPVSLGVAIWVKLDSPGPVLIHQRRVGAGGVLFTMHKFRTMTWQPEGSDVPGPKRRDDPRVSRSGRFLRRTSLDELPQLWNVLKGEMSLVGPRPELPHIVETYEPWQLKRLVVPPGMTGWWQINGRAEKPLHLNTEADLFYVQNYSVLLDLQILARTLRTVIRGTGAF